MNLAEIEGTLLDERTKGIPGGTPPFPLGDIADKGWNVLGEDLTLPVAVLKESALDHNGRWMRRFLKLSGAVICPHGKTTMSPQLHARQLADGAWGITVATVTQLQVARHYGTRRVLLANQLVGRQAVRYVLEELRRDPEFDFYSLVDSVEGVRLLAEAAREHPPGRPLRLLLEGGLEGGRTGCRDVDTALDVARAIHAASPDLALSGVEGFEGLIMGASVEERAARARAFLDFLVEIALSVEKEGLFAHGPLVLSAGGSAFYDLVVERFARAGFKREVLVVTRSGCYLTHDSGMYEEAFEDLCRRSPAARQLSPGLKPALEIWAYVQSRPEAGLAILTMGRRDCSFDAGLPVPLLWFRPGHHTRPEPLAPAHEVTALNDQHAFLALPAKSGLRVGDMVGSGISHPCTTFDKWGVVFVVDDAYDVVGAVRTFF